MKIYRGIPSKYIKASFIPSGCRDTQIEMMKREIDSFVSIIYSDFEEKLVNTFTNKNSQIFPFYRNADPKSYFNYLLTLLFMKIKLRRNESIEDLFAFQTDLLPTLDGLTNSNRRKLGEFCWEEINIPLHYRNSTQLIQLARFKRTLVVSGYFQHLNYIFGTFAPTFPTLGLDWTGDYSIAKNFGDVIVSIDYKKYLSLTSGWGVSSYTEPLNKDNRLMVDQKGYIIFWPWKFTIEELKANSFGKSIDFRVEE